MTGTRACPECGTELPADSPEGLCAKCLLQVAMSSLADTRQRETAALDPRPSAAVPTPAELARYFPHLEILELLGKGGMGVVYKARQPKLDRLVALKILPLDSAQDPAFAERFTREARALAMLSHPNIVAVYDFGEVDGLYYFLMEYVDGLNLRQILRSRHLQPDDALKLVPQICDALQYAHDEGVVHRDIKPENILLDKKGRIKIADFGLAKLLTRTPADYTLTGAYQVMGTPHYMAPEQMLTPLAVDHRADIYSLGVVLYEMLTGDLPLGRFPPPSQKVQIDARLDEIVLRALEREPERRYQRVSEVKTHLAALTSSRAPISPASFQEAGFPSTKRDSFEVLQAPNERRGPIVRKIISLWQAARSLFIESRPSEQPVTAYSGRPTATFVGQTPVLELPSTNGPDEIVLPEAVPTQVQTAPGPLLRWLGNTTLWAMLLCFAGAAASLFPWAELELTNTTKFSHPFGDFFNAFPQMIPQGHPAPPDEFNKMFKGFNPQFTVEVPKTVRVPYYATWHGIALCALLFISGILLLFTLAHRPARVWRALFIVLVALGSLAILYLYPPVRLTEGGELLALAERLVPQTSDMPLQRVRVTAILAGPKVNLGVGIGLLLLGVIQLRSALVRHRANRE